MGSQINTIYFISSTSVDIYNKWSVLNNQHYTGLFKLITNIIIIDTESA